jgi:hypothetical protein
VTGILVLQDGGECPISALADPNKAKNYWHFLAQSAELGGRCSQHESEKVFDRIDRMD